jgi:hypothetical protein
MRQRQAAVLIEVKFGWIDLTAEARTVAER